MLHIYYIINFKFVKSSFALFVNHVKFYVNHFKSVFINIVVKNPSQTAAAQNVVSEIIKKI